MPKLGPLPEHDVSVRGVVEGESVFALHHAYSIDALLAYAAEQVALADREWFGKVEAADAELTRLHAEVKCWRERFPNHHYRPQDNCIELRGA